MNDLENNGDEMRKSEIELRELLRTHLPEDKYKLVSDGLSAYTKELTEEMELGFQEAYETIKILSDQLEQYRHKMDDGDKLI